MNSSHTLGVACRAAGLGGVLLALSALAACTDEVRRSSPIWITCKADASDADAQKRKVAACSDLIKGGLEKDDLGLALKSRADGERGLSEWDPAIADDTQATGLDPADSAALADRGLARYGQGKYDLAMADFNGALKLDTGNANALNGRAFAERRMGDVDSAIHDEDRAIEIKPDWAQPWTSRGLAFLAKGWFDMALADFRDAARLDHTDTDALDGAAEALKGKGDKPNAVKAYLAAAEAYLDQKDYDSAITRSSKALDLAPDDPDALNSRCWSRAVGDAELDQAEADCQRSLTVRPGSPAVLDSLAFVRFRQGRYPEALEGFNNALAKNPKQAASLYMRGIVKLRLGDQAGGQQDLQTAQSQDSDVAARYGAWGISADNSAQ